MSKKADAIIGNADSLLNLLIPRVTRNDRETPFDVVVIPTGRRKDKLTEISLSAAEADWSICRLGPSRPAYPLSPDRVGLHL